MKDDRRDEHGVEGQGIKLGDGDTQVNHFVVTQSSASGRDIYHAGRDIIVNRPPAEGDVPPTANRPPMGNRAPAGGLPGLRPDEEAALCAAVLSAYSRDELEMLLYQDCGGIRLDVVAPAGVNLEVTVFKVVAAARTRGWIATFVEAAIARRPGNTQLRAWATTYDTAVRSRVPASRGAPEPVPAQLLMDPAHFDLTEIRRAIRTALQDPAGPVIGFGVRYPESLFVQKLLDWLQFYLSGETQSKATLSLMPEIAPLDYCLRQLQSYRADLDEVNVLCEIAVRGVEADVIEEFWNGVRAEFHTIPRNLVLVFTGDPRSHFPEGATALPQPKFSRADVADWTERLISDRGWPGSVARGWTEWLCAAASIRDEHLDVRLLYEAMDRSVTVFRREPERFRAMHENATHEERS